MKINLKRIDDDYLFEMTNGWGNSILLNNLVDENSKGVSPMESVLMGLVGCASIDVVSILKKQRQNITSFEAEVEAERKEMKEAKPFSAVHIRFKLAGDIDPKKAERAAELSFEKYCSVSMSLNPEIKIDWSIEIDE